LNTASPRGAKAEGVCWMMRCSDEVRNRKNFWSRDSASSDFHMYETAWYSAYTTARLWSIALRSIRTVNLLISKWSRFAVQWRADLLILRRWSRNQASQHDCTKIVDESSIHGITEDDRERRTLNEAVKFSNDSIDGLMNEIIDDLIDEILGVKIFYIMRWIFHLDLADRAQ
jgi:hypothetical protein